MAFETEIAPFIEHLAIERGFSPNTVEAYGRDLKLFAEHCALRGVTSPRNVDVDAVATFAAFLSSRRKYKSSSAARSLAAARTFLRFLVNEGALAKDPSAGVETPKQWRRLPHVLSQEDAGALTEAPVSVGRSSGSRQESITPPGPPLLRGGKRKKNRGVQLRDHAILELLY